MRDFKLKEEYKPIVKRIILADGFWYGSKRDRKKALRIELPDIKRKHIDFIVDLCVSYDKVHGDGWSEARNHTLNNNLRKLMEEVGLSITSIPPAPKEAGILEGVL